jgi:hypothetical protein
VPNSAADEFWTVDHAAAHLKVTRSTIERYIRGGLPVYFKALGGRVKRSELLAEYRARKLRQRATRLKPVVRSAPLATTISVGVNCSRE